MPPKNAQSKKDEILGIASKLFYEQGYGNTGIAQIIEEAGTAKGTFYSHFKSKEALGIAWLQVRNADWSKALERFLQSSETGSDRFLKSFDFLRSDMEASDYRGCAFLNTLAETPQAESALRKEIVSSKRGLRDHFIEALRPTRPDEAEALGSLIYMLFEATIVEMQNFRTAWPAETARQHVAELLA